MTKAHVVLRYKRTEDQMPATLAAPLPTVRPLEIGGDPGELRLPGAPPEARYAMLSSVESQFFIEPLTGAEVRVNDEALSESGVFLHDGDIIQIGEYRLTFAEGSPDDEYMLELNQRWGLYSKPRLSETEPKPEDPSRPYIEEFEQVIRPLKQNDEHIEIRKRAESELKRLLRADEGDALGGYSAYLWWLRVSSAIEAGEPDVVALAREAYDLHSDRVQVLSVCGQVFLRARELSEAQRIYAKLHALPPDQKRSNVLFVHEARAALLLLDHLRRLGAAGEIPGAKPLGQWDVGDWNLPELRTDTPGDELMIFYLARNAELFAPKRDLRFVYRGPAEPRPNPREMLLRWEIFDVERRRSWRWLIRTADTLYADPSLLCESAFLRDMLDRADRLWDEQVLSSAEDSGRQPLRLTPAALQALPPPRGTDPLWIRVSANQQSRTRPFRVAVVAQPQRGDTIYSLGEVNVALAPQIAEGLNGAKLDFPSRQTGFRIELPSGEKVNAAYEVRAGWGGRVRMTQIIKAGVALLILYIIAAIIAVMVRSR